MMKRKKIQQAAGIIVFFIACIGYQLHAEQFTDSALGYMIDLPEGFKPVNKREHSRYIYQHTIIPVGLQIAVYPHQQFTIADQAAAHIFNQLNAEKKILYFLLHGQPALAAHIQFALHNQKQAGWLLTVPLPEQKGWLVLLTYTAAEKAQEYEPLMISTLDALFIERQSFFEPGPMMQAVYPKTAAVKTETVFNGKPLRLYFDSADSEANQAVIDREFAVLTLYLNSPLRQEAWKRYYRMIYRDSWSRCRHIALMLEKELINVDDKGKRPPADKTAAAVLEWLQNFTYTRNQSTADFLNIPAVCTERSGDCDSRALLMAVILQQLDIDSILLISPEHKHAVAAVDCAGEGARFKHNGKRYLIAETTAQVPLGRIAEEQSDPSLWFAVERYEPPVQ